MPKVKVLIGYEEEQREISPDVWKAEIVEKRYSAEIIKNNTNYQSSDTINTDFLIGNSFSILSNPYIRDNIQRIRYLTYMGVKWKITGIEILYPRLTINVGGIYNA